MKLQVCPLVWHLQYTIEVKSAAGGGGKCGREASCEIS